jgi:hypothetical protein
MLAMVPRALSAAELDRYDHIPRALAARVRLFEVPALAPGTDAMALGRLVLVRRGHGRSGSLIAHELVHVQQWDRLGAVGFLGQYLLSYLRNLVRLRRHRLAYLAIPLEVEARERARRWAETDRGRHRAER